MLIPIRSIDVADVWAVRGWHQPLHTLTPGLAYTIERVKDRSGVIFVVLEHPFIDEYNVITIPQSCRQTFEHFVRGCKDFGVRSMYFLVTQTDDPAKPAIHVHGGGFCSKLC